MKSLKLLLASLLLLSTAACTPNVVRDPAPASIDVGHKRVETVVCGHQDVGENGCILPKGQTAGAELQIRKVLNGKISIIGQGCNVDKNFEYTYDGQEWITLNLADLIGPNLASDCVLDIYQYVTFPGADKAPFPIEGIYGTVTLGECPDGAQCSFDSQQVRVGWAPGHIAFSQAAIGTYLLRGCGQQLSTGPFTNGLDVDPATAWPSGYPQAGKNGCLFILAVKSNDGNLYKIYHKIWIFDEQALALDEPSVSAPDKDGKVSFIGDSAVSLTYVDAQPINSGSGTFTPSPTGDWMRFYTAQGRVLVVFFKDGKIQWVK